MARERNASGQFVDGPPEGNQHALKHGGEGALKRVLAGEPFIGLAREVEEEVRADFAIDLDSLSGLKRAYAKRVMQFEATARMFDTGALAAAASGDVDKYRDWKRRGAYPGRLALSGMKEIMSWEDDAAGTYDAQVKELLSNA